MGRLCNDVMTHRIRLYARAMLCCAGLAVIFPGTGMAQTDDIRIGGTGGALATVQQLADAYAKISPGVRITVLPSLGSGGGIKAVLAGSVQIALSSRPLKPDEIQKGASAVEYARTPFVFATAATNRVAGLSMQELVDIYAGKTERWPDGTRIRLVLRPIGDSDSDMIKTMSAAMRDAKTKAEQRKGMTFAVTDQEAADSLEKISGALGPTTLAQIISEKRSLKALRLDNVEPGVQSIADGRYPYYKTLLIVTTPQTSPAARQFIAYVQSAPGREILIRTGHWVK